MKNIVITYGTFDLFHEGHRRLLERAKALGDYLIVGVTSDAFDHSRGKINVEQTLAERIKNVEDAHIADKIIVEEYEGQKIDDIKRYGVSIFTVGSDWEGKFDYLNEYCKVIYLPRTEGVSSSEIRSEEKKLRIGAIGNTTLSRKVLNECHFVNGVEVSGYASLTNTIEAISSFDSYESLLENTDAVYIASTPDKHYRQVKQALNAGKHVLCESPIALTLKDYDELVALAKSKGLVLMDGIKTAYSTAYCRLLLMIKGGAIGDVISIDSTSTSLRKIEEVMKEEESWPSIYYWAPTDLLPILQVFGTEHLDAEFISKFPENNNTFDLFTKININYPHATATSKSGIGIKSEGDLIISGTKGYIYVPSPWWKTDYFEIRFENPSENKKVFYQLDGEGIRYEILSFYRSIKENRDYSNISSNLSRAIVMLMEQFNSKEKVTIL